MSELAGKVALVTGGGRNIGRAICLALAKSGVAVAVNARLSGDEAESVVREISAAGGKAIPLLGDVANEADVMRMVKEIAATLGGIDILINNAAIRHEAPLEKISLKDWHATLGVTLDGAFLCAKACLPLLRKSASGAIVNIGGMTAQTGASQRAHVVTAKAGLEGLTRALALELAPDGITVNCVVPGLVETSRGGSSAGAEVAHHAGRKPLLGRRTPPSDIAAMVRHLCGPDARFVTGQVIHVNGGNYLGG
jgi:3-oxoacyl-[acyl-carrier protein] reductase